MGADTTEGSLSVRASRALSHRGCASYQLSGRWLAPLYAGLRNAAWAARNSRVAADQNPAALLVVLREAERLLAADERLLDVLEAFAELLMRP